MISQGRAIATIPTHSLAASREFYEKTLGFRPVPGETGQNGQMMYAAGGDSEFLLFETPYAGTAQHTQMAIEVDDLKAETADLRARGVTFAEYDQPGLKTVNGIASMPDGGQAAWFRDPEGNWIAVVHTAGVTAGAAG
jgi:catechol 2,3-dioxygenase-like lactoylglutathione lyase family enzyme